MFRTAIVIDTVNDDLLDDVRVEIAEYWCGNGMANDVSYLNVTRLLAEFHETGEHNNCPKLCAWLSDVIDPTENGIILIHHWW